MHIGVIFFIVSILLCSEDLENKYGNKLTREMSGPEYEIISRIMKTLVNKKITVPGSFIGSVYLFY